MRLRLLSDETVIGEDGKLWRVLRAECQAAGKTEILETRFPVELGREEKEGADGERRPEEGRPERLPDA